MFYKFRSEKALEIFKDDNSSNYQIGDELGTGIFSANVDDNGDILVVHDTDLSDRFVPVFSKDEISKYLVNLSNDNYNEPNDDVNSWKNCLLVTRSNLMTEIYRIDGLLSKMG